VDVVLLATCWTDRVSRTIKCSSGLSFTGPSEQIPSFSLVSVRRLDLDRFRVVINCPAIYGPAIISLSWSTAVLMRVGIVLVVEVSVISWQNMNTMWSVLAKYQ
jgi:hypothetical protein